MKRIVLRFFTLLILAGGAVIFWDRYVAWSTEPLIRRTLPVLPSRECALLLGTNKYLTRGRLNWYYRYRIDAAETLYRRKKVKKILLSGDGRSRYYDEVKRMRRDLIRRGVPDSVLIQDPAGVRTIESVRQALERFGCREPIIVTQPFHLERALFIARALGMKPLGFAAKAPEYTPAALRMRLREILARGRMVWDLLLLKFWRKDKSE